MHLSGQSHHQVLCLVSCSNYVAPVHPPYLARVNCWFFFFCQLSIFCEQSIEMKCSWSWKLKNISRTFGAVPFTWIQAESFIRWAKHATCPYNERLSCSGFEELISKCGYSYSHSLAHSTLQRYYKANKVSNYSRLDKNSWKHVYIDHGNAPSSLWGLPIPLRE